MAGDIFERFPPIPDRLSFKIGEAAQLVGVKPHVLRYWEQEFGKLRPRKGSNGHRAYVSADIERLRRIKLLLHEHGFTISGARSLFQRGEAAVDGVLAGAPQAPEPVVVDDAPLQDENARLVERLARSERQLKRAQEEAAFWRAEMRRAEARLARVIKALRAWADESGDNF